MKRIAVFCGSSSGTDSRYMQEAFALGRLLAEKNITLVYGGAQVGLMGSVANGALSCGGKVIGILPSFLGSKEIAHPSLTELIMVDTMHERKMKMHELSDGVIALPGGFGTLEELFEMTTWAQLGLHRKPIGLLNLFGFYQALVQLIHHMHQTGFLKPVHLKMLLTSDHSEDLLAQMAHYQAPDVAKWITSETT